MPKNPRRLALTLLSAAAIGATGLVVPSSASAQELSTEEVIELCDKGASSDGYYKRVSCTFVADKEEFFKVFNRLGAPVENCAPGATQPISLMVGDVRTDTETWKVGGGATVEIGPVKVEGKPEYSQSRSQSTERRVTVTAAVGRKNALTVGTEFARQNGAIKVVATSDNGGSGDPGPQAEETFYAEGMQRDVPTGNTSTGQDDVPCGQKFTVDPEKS